MPKVFIIILHWNNLIDTLECLASLQKIDYPNYQVVVIDNGSKNKFEVLSYKLKVIRNEKNLGFAGGNNVGIKYALEQGADYVLLLNNDTTVRHNFLTKLVEIAESDRRFGISGPVIFYYDEPDKIQFAGGKINWSKTRGTHRLRSYQNNFLHNKREVEIVDYITGCCLLIKREVIEKTGLMSEDYFLYYEDGDWCFRARNLGYKCILVLSAMIYHKQSKSSGDRTYPYIYYHTRNGLIFSSRFGFKPLTYLISFWIFLKQIIKLIIGYKKEWARPVMKGVIDFWKREKGKLEGYYN